jgi:hypothetical protein
MGVDNHCDWRHGCVFLIFYSWSRPVESGPVETCESKKKKFLLQASKDLNVAKALENLLRFEQGCKKDEDFPMAMSAALHTNSFCFRKAKKIVEMAMNDEFDDAELSTALKSYSTECRDTTPDLLQMVKEKRPGCDHRSCSS